MLALKSWMLNRRVGWAGGFFILGVLLKPFYVFPSGSVGLGDICMAVCACILLAGNIRDRKGFALERKDLLLYIFLICVCLINGIYYIKFRSREYLVFTLYWIYAVMIVWSFRQVGGRPEVALLLKNVLQVSLLLQLVIWMTGTGRTYYEYWGATRYMGTFNNPNQMAYIIFLMLLLLYFYEEKLLYFWPFWLISGLLIVVTKSTGVFLGWAGLGGFEAVAFLHCFCKGNERRRKVWRLLWGLAAAGAIVGLWAIWPAADFRIEDTDYSLLARIQEKIYKIWTGGLQGLIYDRGWERLILYPKYLLFGAGEGDYGRFPLSVWKSEIHSTFLSVWFYYGTIPLLLFLSWLYQNLKDNIGKYWPVYAALFLECMIVINYRQPFFWMVILAGCVTHKNTFGGKNETGNRIMGKVDGTGSGGSCSKEGIGRNLWKRK